MPEISVIVPVYKTEQYLPACVDSILAQTFSDFELILVDDGSPDSCGALCDAYAGRDPRIRVIHRENGGLSAARNSGMDLAEGAYLAFVDSDDLLAEDCLEILYSAATRQNAEIAVCRFFHFTREDELPRRKKAVHPKEVLLQNVEAVCAIYRGDQRNPVNACAKLFRADVVGAMRFPPGRLHEDQAIVPILCYNARSVVSVNARLYCYREREESITTNAFSLKRYDDIWAIDSCIDFFEARGETEIVDAAREKRQRVLCAYAILAKADGVTVPAEYAVPTGKALRYLRRHASNDKYTYYLSLIHPKLVRPYAYLTKLKQMFSKEK